MEEQIRQKFIDKLNHNKGRTTLDDTGLNEETSTVGIEDDFFGDSLNDFVKENDKKEEKLKNNNLESGSNSDSDNE